MHERRRKTRIKNDMRRRFRNYVGGQNAGTHDVIITMCGGVRFPGLFLIINDIVSL